MSKILILGAGNAQIDLINSCHEAGMEVYCVSYSGDDPGVKLADHFAEINIVDLEAVKKYFLENQIDYIYSVGSDIAVPVYNRIAEETGAAHFIDSESAKICCSKRRLRSRLKDKPYNLPHVSGRSLDEIVQSISGRDFFPAEMKPVDSQGQRGVSTVRSMSKLPESFRKAIEKSREGCVILEKIVEGPEVSVNAYVRDGKVIFSMLSDREVWPQYPGGVIHRHHIPSRFEGTKVHERILDLVQDVVTALDLRNGPVYFQIMVEKEHPYLIEVTPRLDGCHMWRLIREACGADLLQMTMNHLMSGDPLKGQEETFAHLSQGSRGEVTVPKKDAVHLEFFCQAPGEAYDPKRFEDLPAVYSQMYYKEGETVRPINGYMEKCGYRIYHEPAGS